MLRKRTARNPLNTTELIVIALLTSGRLELSEKWPNVRPAADSQRQLITCIVKQQPNFVCNTAGWMSWWNGRCSQTYLIKGPWIISMWNQMEKALNLWNTIYEKCRVCLEGQKKKSFFKKMYRPGIKLGTHISLWILIFKHLNRLRQLD